MISVNAVLNVKNWSLTAKLSRYKIAAIKMDQKAKELLDRVREKISLNNYANKTEQAYVNGRSIFIVSCSYLASRNSQAR